MIKINLNFKIHIPGVRALNEYLRTSSYLQTESSDEVQKNIVEKYATNLLPYLRGLESVHIQSNGQFKAGLSINGITLNQLLEHAPEVVEQLKKMHSKGCIEILSEPWSHSIVPFFNEKSLIRQIQLHDISIQSVFETTPQIFIMHSPSYLPHFLETVSGLGKKAVFTNLNQFKNEFTQKSVLESADNGNHVTVLPINYKISKMLQKLDFYPYTDENSGFSKNVLNKIQNHVTDNNPVIAMYNLTKSKNLFHLSKTVTWQKFLRDLLTENRMIFTSPSESVEKYNSVNNSNNLPNSVLSRSKLDDTWLENKHQIQAFDRQLRINTLMMDETDENLVKEWDVIQDMENLFYMNQRFNKNRYSKHYFTLFDDPDAAYFSYISVLESFMEKLLERKKYMTGISEKTKV